MLVVGYYLQICYLWKYDIRNSNIGDDIISESYIYIDLSPVDSSLVNFFSSEL